MAIPKSLPMRHTTVFFPLKRVGPVLSSRSLATIRERLSTTLQDAVQATAPRTNWTREEISDLYNSPLMELSYAAVGF